MTEISWWWESHTVGDATDAPYIATDWSTLERAKFLSWDNTQGVFGSVLNSLEVYQTSASGVTVKSGAACVKGRLYYNDADTAEFAVSGASKYWLIGVLSTEAAQTIRAFASGPHNTEALAIAALVHAANWSIPLATVLTTAGGAVNYIHDIRDFALRPNLRLAFVPAISGYNVTDATYIIRNELRGVPLPDAHHCQAFGRWAVPPGYWQTMSVQAVTTSAGAGVGNCYQRGIIYYNNLGEIWNSHSETLAYAADAMGLDALNIAHSFTSPAIPESEGDLIFLTFDRDATNILDTISDTVFMSGWIIQYAPLY